MSVRSMAAGFHELRTVVNDPTPRVGLGLPYLNSRLNGGLLKGQVAMFMAFSHVGKTTLALNAIKENSNIPILFFSIEMSWDQVVSKLTAMETNKSTALIESEFKGQEQPDYVQQIMDKHRLLLCDDAPDLSMKNADASFEDATEILAAQSQPPPRLVVFDYLELIQGGGLMEKASAVDKAAEKVHVFARKHRTSAILVHQVGKAEAGGGSEPLDLGSGRYGGHQTMDVVVGMSSPGASKSLAPQERESIKNHRLIQILKNRPTGQTDVSGRLHHLDPVSMVLSDLSTYQPNVWAGANNYSQGALQ